MLDRAARAYLERLSPTASRDGVELFHGSARDPVWEYVLSEEAAWWTLQATTAPLVLVGHSHVPLAIWLDGGDLGGGVARGGAEADLGSGRWLLNPGSVGQPRDGDPRAGYGLLDSDARELRLYRIAYPVEEAQRKIIAAGLPVSLANRLALGR